MLAVSDFLLYATVVQLVERRISIPNVAGSYPVSRSICYRGGMADTGDLKSPVGNNVPVQVGSVAPLFECQHTKMKGTKYYEFYYQSVGVLSDWYG